VREVPDGAGSRVRYAITDRGREAQPIMKALARFGMDLLEDPAEVPHVRPWSAVQTCLVAYFDRSVADELAVDERYLVRVDGEDTLLSSVRGGGAPQAPVLTVDAAARTWFALRQGRITWDQAAAAGDLDVVGPKAAARRFRRLFALA
jgi:hypothetical protein